MSKNAIILLIYPRHKLLDVVYNINVSGDREYTTSRVQKAQVCIKVKFKWTDSMMYEIPTCLFS
jgi:hypothetical protein